ncbi:hypothetical protein BOX15_Mlig024669g3 [Macrostomum lignano]|uniref:WAP domain-containing protein n=1 Tax=Macrostomum lignano TaxID=282301 RepID=A0A267H1P7_9PLAT|nr:hypothetical protein BOX15_Mlig024669g3 [Macrostomum lignano]
MSTNTPGRYLRLVIFLALHTAPGILGSRPCGKGGDPCTTGPDCCSGACDANPAFPFGYCIHGSTAAAKSGRSSGLQVSQRVTMLTLACLLLVRVGRNL